MPQAVEIKAEFTLARQGAVAFLRRNKFTQSATS
jgi:hypothetical protein